MSPFPLPRFKVGERVVDAFGKEGKVMHVDPTAEHGLGTIRILYDDGRLHDYALSASGLERVK
jgi:hypothetical protein